MNLMDGNEWGYLAGWFGTILAFALVALLLILVCTWRHRKD